MRAERDFGCGGYSRGAQRVRLGRGSSLAAIFLILLSAQRVPARSWYVLPDSTGDAPTIQAAIDSSSSGDTVLVAPGTYYVNLNIAVRDDLVLRSEAGPEVTILDGRYANPGALKKQVIQTAQSDGVLIEGFTIQKGRPPRVAGWGGGLLLGSRTTVRGNIIRECANEHGGGLSFAYSCWQCAGSVIEENQFVDNESSEGPAAIYLSDVHDYPPVLITNNVFVTNSGEYGAIEGNVARVSVSHNRFIGNTSNGAYGAVLYVYGSGSLSVEYNTLLRNTGHAIVVNGVYSGGVVANNTAVENSNCGIGGYAVTVQRNLVAGNGYGMSSCGAFKTCNDAWGNVNWDYDPNCDSTGHSGNISADPMFCGPESDDYSIASESPCAPQNSGGCGLIGASDVGCAFTSVPVGHAERASWGTVKKLFR